MAKEILLSTPDELKALISETVRGELTTFFCKEEKSENRLRTRKEVAEMLGISLVTLSSWTKEGIIKAVRIGNSIRYKIEDVEQALRDIRSIKYSRGRTIINVQL